MIKRMLHIFLVLMMAPALSTAKSVCSYAPLIVTITPVSIPVTPVYFDTGDTTKVKKEPEDKKKIKEIPQARRQSKPEKLILTPIDTLGNKGRVKLPRQRRPDGLVRPPEIPRRNNN